MLNEDDDDGVGRLTILKDCLNRYRLGQFKTYEQYYASKETMEVQIKVANCGREIKQLLELEQAKGVELPTLEPMTKTLRKFIKD